MMRGPVFVYVARGFWHREGVTLVIYRQPDANVPNKFEYLSENGWLPVTPELEMSSHLETVFLPMLGGQAQRLMDGLWDCGIRPTEGSGSAGSLAATERHLKDLQRLVFDHFLRDVASRQEG